MIYKTNNYITLWQVFTPQFIVDDMLKLIKNNGNILEPSCGNGVFSKNLKNVISIEIDKNVCPDYALNIDFFDYSVDNKFDTIIGNPPYVRFQDIQEQTKNKLDMSLFDERSNLYLFFVKVGAVIGADSLFENKNGNIEFVCSYTNKTDKTKRMFYNIKKKKRIRID